MLIYVYNEIIQLGLKTNTYKSWSKPLSTTLKCLIKRALRDYKTRALWTFEFPSKKFRDQSEICIHKQKLNYETSCWSAVSLHVPKTAKSIFASFTYLRHVQNRYPTLENTCMYKQCLELSKGLSKKAGTQCWIAAKSLLKKMCALRLRCIVVASFSMNFIFG